MNDFGDVVNLIVDNYLELFLTIVIVLLTSWGNQLREQYKDREVDNRLMEAARRAVLAAEEMLASGQEKEKWVVYVLAEQFPNIDEEYIRIAVKSVVRLMKSHGFEKKNDNGSEAAKPKTDFSGNFLGVKIDKGF